MKTTEPDSRPAPPVVLTIAGSDSGGGAGIQADLKTFAAYGTHGLSAITYVTAQNTHRVSAVHAVPVRILDAQIDALFADFAVAAVKIGMLGTPAIARCVARALRRYGPRVSVVLDPVMVATSGDPLLTPETVDIYRRELLPRADLVTPNVPEAEALTGQPLGALEDFDRAAATLHELGARAVLLKGGHAPGADVLDILYAGDVQRFRHPRLPGNAHGTGCTLAAAIAAGLAHGLALSQAAGIAIDYVHRALALSYRPGTGGLSVLAHGEVVPALQTAS